jgi:glycosyltransferase involved in cell wall biosynthesis
MDGLLRAARAAALEAAESFEILVIDDGSRLDEAQALDRMAASCPEVRVIHHDRNRGYGAAIRRGIAESRMGWVFYTDGDGQYDPGDIRLLWRSWQAAPDADMFNGYKLKRHDPWPRVWLGEIYRRLARGLFALPIRDVDCDFRLMRGEFVRSLPLRCSGGGVGLELVRCAQARGARFIEAAIPHHPRRSGRSEFFTLRRVAQLAREMLSGVAR